MNRREHQLELEELYDKHQLMGRVRRAFQEDTNIPFAEIMTKLEFPQKFGFDLLAQMAVRKRADVPTLVGCLRHHCDSDQETASLVEKAVNLGFLEYSSRDKQLIVIFGIQDSLQAALDRLQYPLPMVVPPEPVKTNLDTGYLSSKGSVILRDNHHEDDVCLDHLNRVNSIQYVINLDTAQMVKNKWRNLDKKKEDETWEEFQKRRKAFEKYDSVSKDVITLLLGASDGIYLTHRYDKRGRTYCAGFHVNYQGNDWNKAVIQFAHKEALEE